VDDICLIRYRREANLNRQQKQANLLIRINCILIIFVMGENYLIPLIPGWKIASQSPILFSIWMGGMVYAIWKYGSLRISPQALENKILDSVEDLVILYSIDGKVVYRNRKALEILGNSAIATTKSLEGRVYERLFVKGGGEEGEKLVKMKAVSPVLKDRASWFADQPEELIKLRIPAAGTDGSNNTHKLSEKEAQSITVNFRTKPLLDRFEDPLGVLVSGTIVPRFVDILKTNKFTTREAEVLECLMAGCTIGKTSSLLNITERTVKAHITNIYEKTGAANRIELANMLNGS